MLVTPLFNRTYQFINNELMTFWHWPEIKNLLLTRHRVRAGSVNAWIDTLPILACTACGGDFEQSIPLAAAWSLYIFAGRILDDIQDDEGKEHLWNQEGAKQALPTASFIMGIAQMALARLQPLSQANADILDAFGRAVALAAQAQREQLGLALETLSIDLYFNNLIARTAVAFATASWSGARVATAAPEVLEALYNYGMAVGIAIQIEDDCRDLVKSDMVFGIYTLPVIYALSQTQHTCHADLLSLLSVPEKMSAAQVSDTATILTDMKAFDWSRRMAHIYRVKAVDALSSMPPESDTRYLRDFALGNC